MVFGKYEKIRRIAQGGMGEVFLARQTGVLDRLAILKALRHDLAKEVEFVDQFLDEARVAATLNHPNIVAIYDVGEWHNTYYIAMEYIAGEDLSKLWYAAAKAGIGLPFQVSVRIIMEAALGLDHAHRAKDVRGQPLSIVHRDVSPQNIMVRADGVTKLVDFGIAKAANKNSRTQAGMVKGKLQYMSPEQVRGEPLDGRSDQFSLGIVLWEMCTGRRLFKADTEINTLQKILQTPIPRPTQHVPGFPAELEAVIVRMLERDPNKRFTHLGEVAARLKEYLDRSSVASGEVGVAAFVQQILGKELDARIADLTPMEPTEASAPVPAAPSRPAPKKIETRVEPLAAVKRAEAPRKPEPPPPSSQRYDDDKDSTVVIGPDQRPDRPGQSSPSVDDGLEGLALGPQGEWVVRRVDGKAVHFQAWATLQQWCLDGKLGRDDEVSADGRRFARLGDDVVLAGFFAAAEGSRRPAAPAPAPAPAPVLQPAAASSMTTTTNRAALDTMPIGDAVGALEDLPPAPPPSTTTHAAGSQADPFGAPADPFAPAPTGAFSLGALPTSHTGAWQFGTDRQALAAAAQAGKPAAALAGPRRRVPVAMWAALGVVGSLVLVVAGLRVFAPSTMATITGAQLVSTQKTTSALAAIHTDEPGTVEALSQTLQSALGDDATVDALVAATLVQAERTRLLAVASALVARTGDTAAADVQAAQVASARQTLLELQARLDKAVGPQAAVDESERRWAMAAMAVAASSPPASAESLTVLAAVSGDDVIVAEARAWRGLVMGAQTLNDTAASAAALDGVVVAGDDKRLDGLRAVVAAVAANDDASRAAARRALLTRQQRSPTDVRWRAATQLLETAEAAVAVAVAATTTTTTTTTKPEPAPAAPAAPVEVEPETFESAFRKGQKAQRNGRSKEAVRLLTIALGLKPDDPNATLALGWAQLDLGRTATALMSFQAVLAAGSMPEAQFGLGETLRAMGRTTDAVAAFEKYLELAPSGPDAETAKNAITALQ